jgi:hypothetical protein
MCRKRSSQTCQLGAVIAALLFVLAFFGQAKGQYAKVKQATAETNDRLRFTAWLKQQTVTLKQDVTIYYQVQNRSNKTIYLIQKDGELETSADGDTLNLPFVIVTSGDSDSYHYNFTKVQQGKTQKGQLVIPAGKFKRDQVWLVNVSFGFVTDINGLDRKLRPNEDPAPFRGLLEERILLVGVNGLVVEVEVP